MLLQPKNKCKHQHEHKKPKKKLKLKHKNQNVFIPVFACIAFHSMKCCVNTESTCGLMHGSILPVTIPPPPPGHTPGNLQFFSHLGVYSPPPGMQKETIPHPRDSSSTTNTLFCVQNIDGLIFISEQ